MKKHMIKMLVASVATIAIVISCLLAGLALPVSAAATAQSFALSTTETLYLLSEHGSNRTYKLGGGTVTYTDSTTKTYTAAELEWKVGNNALATITNGVIKAGATTGTTTLTATVPNLTDANGNALTATRTLVVVDGSNYVYSNPEYTYGAELITNGDFEQGAGTGWTSTAPIQDDAGKTGKGFVLNKSTTQYYQGSFSDKILPGNTYEIKFDYKASAGSSFYLWSSTLGSSNLNVKPTLNSTDNGNTWKTYTYVFTQPAELFLNANYDLGIVSAAANATYPVTIDNLSIREVKSTVTVESVKLSYDRLTLQQGSTFQLKAQTAPYEKYLNDLTWTSSNPAVAVVNYGYVSAVSAGVATITVTTPNGKTASCVVTVTEGTSLIANGTFENTASTVWTYSTKSSSYSVGTGSYKSTAAKVAVGNTVQQTFTGLEPNTTYIVSGSVRQTAKKHADITVANGEYTAAFAKKTASVHHEEFSFEFTTPAVLTEQTSTLTLTTRSETSANTCHFDNIVLVKVCDVDLMVESVDWDGDNGKGQVNPGAPITFKAIIKNKGTEAVPVGKAFTIDIASNGSVLRTLTYTGGIAAGATVTVTDTEAWTAVAGDHMISARVNASQSIYETNMETNNTHQLNLRVANDRVAPTYDAVADAVEQAGMDRLTMSDDFDSLDTIDTTGGGKEGYRWYVNRMNGASSLTPNDYRADNGVLTIMNEVNAYNASLYSADLKTKNGFLFNKGYLEVKIRIPRPDWCEEDVGSPAIWSFTENKALSGRGDGSHWVELDWLEYWGVSGQFPEGYYTVTTHDTTTSRNYRNNNYSMHGLADMEWHVMGWLWEHNSIRAFLDGVETMALFFDKNMPSAPAQYPEENYTIVGTSSDPGIFSLANEMKSILYLGGSKDVPLEVDYVRIWQQSEPATVSNNMILDKTDITMWECDRERLTVTVPQGQDVGTLTWESSNPSVATVHGNGEVLARSEGTAVITATNANGIAVMCTVHVKHNVIVGGDFEWESDILYRQWKEGVLASSNFSVVSESDGNNCLAIKPGAGFRYYHNLDVQKNATYRFTGKIKGQSSITMYFTSPPFASVDDQNTTKDDATKSAGTRALQGKDLGDGWYQFDAILTTNNGSLNGGNSILAFKNESSTKALYVDDLVLTRGEDTQQAQYALTVDNVTKGSLQLTVDDKAVQSGSLVTPGSEVVVTASPSNGYRLKPGSLQYTYAHATRGEPKTEARKVLNKDSSDFGDGFGNRFSFVMPSSATTLSAVFENTGLPVATLGTSVYENENGQISGVRFLNRLYYTADTSFENNKIFVMHNGAKREVVEFGTLLKRSVNESELKLENYEQYKNASGDSRIWKTTAYNNQGDTITLVDYTEGYMDFTIVMTSSVANRYSFLSREYTTCAYLKFSDGEEVYCDAFTDSVLSAQARR